MSKKSDAKAAKGKGGGGPQAVADDHIRLSTHPSALASVRRTRARCGLAAFVLVALLSMHAKVPAFESVERALVAGLVAQLGGWLVAISLWRQVIRVQITQVGEAHAERRHALAQEAVERAAAQMGAQQAAKAEAAADWAATIVT
jgi:hypothetical protein